MACSRRGRARSSPQSGDAIYTGVKTDAERRPRPLVDGVTPAVDPSQPCSSGAIRANGVYALDGGQESS